MTAMTDDQIDRIGYQSDGPDDLKSCLDLIGNIASANTNGDALSAVMDFRKAQRMAAVRAALAVQPGTVQWCKRCGEGVVPGMCRNPSGA